MREEIEVHNGSVSSGTTVLGTINSESYETIALYVRCLGKSTGIGHDLTVSLYGENPISNSAAGPALASVTIPANDSSGSQMAVLHPVPDDKLLVWAETDSATASTLQVGVVGTRALRR